MEEFILTSSGINEPVLFFYVNAPSIIIGRHQNTIDEINVEYVRKHGIRIVRRCSGGGAVYHDLGNLNYSFIRPGDRTAKADFSELLEPIRDALLEIGLPAEISGRNDLLFNGAKFSGNAYYHNRFGSVTHGTLLYDSDLSILAESLRPHPEKLSQKGIRSVRSRVCCIKNALPGIKDIEELEAAIVRHFSLQTEIKYRHFSAAEKEDIEKLTQNRYRNDSWTFGESPAFNIRRLIHFSGGWIDFRADVRQEKVYDVRFFGDFFCSGEISELESAIQGIQWDPEKVTDALNKNFWNNFFPDFPAADFVQELFSVKAGG